MLRPLVSRTVLTELFAGLNPQELSAATKNVCFLQPIPSRTFLLETLDVGWR